MGNYFDENGYPIETCAHEIPIGDHCCNCDLESGFIDECDQIHYGWDYEYNELILPA